MPFVEFFDLVRYHKELEGEARRIGVLDELDWTAMPNRWCLLGLEHFAVMIDRWRRATPDDLPDFWIAQKQKVSGELLRRMGEEPKEEVQSQCST